MGGCRMSKYLSKKEAKELFQKLTRLALSESQLMEKPVKLVPVAEHFNKSGELEFLSSWEHIDFETMRASCNYHCDVSALDISHRYTRQMYQQVNNRYYTRFVFCDPHEKNARPITVAKL
jgi:hypothetical protein